MFEYSSLLSILGLKELQKGIELRRRSIKSHCPCDVRERV